jgi:hypothetical protein
LTWLLIKRAASLVGFSFDGRETAATAARFGNLF